jgi:hypothetical protein
MSNLIYLFIALGLSILGSVILWYRHRKPTSLEAGIDEFSRELRALAPDVSRQESRPG